MNISVLRRETQIKKRKAPSFFTLKGLSYELNLFFISWALQFQTYPHLEQNKEKLSAFEAMMCPCFLAPLLWLSNDWENIPEQFKLYCSWK